LAQKSPNATGMGDLVHWAVIVELIQISCILQEVAVPFDWWLICILAKVRSTYVHSLQLFDLVPLLSKRSARD
jgi:hypothetical protein